MINNLLFIYSYTSTFRNRFISSFIVTLPPLETNSFLNFFISLPVETEIMKNVVTLNQNQKQKRETINTLQQFKYWRCNKNTRHILKYDSIKQLKWSIQFIKCHNYHRLQCKKGKHKHRKTTIKYRKLANYSYNVFDQPARTEYRSSTFSWNF